MFFGYLQAGETEGASMAMECFQYVRNSIVSIKGPTIVGSEELFFKIKDFQMAGNTIFVLMKTLFFQYSESKDCNLSKNNILSLSCTFL